MTQSSSPEYPVISLRSPDSKPPPTHAQAPYLHLTQSLYTSETMPVLSPPWPATAQALTPLTTATLKHRKTFTALFPTLSAETQSELWTAAHFPDNNLPDFLTTHQTEDFWRALHAAYTLSQRYPRALSAAPILRDLLPKMQDEAFARAMDKPCNVSGPLNRHLVHTQQLVFEDAGEWGAWVDKLHRYQCIGVQPRLNLLDARKWSVRDIVEAVKRIQEMTFQDHWGYVLDVYVEVLVDNMAAQAAAEEAAAGIDREGCVEVVLMWDVEVWNFLEAK